MLVRNVEPSIVAARESEGYQKALQAPGCRHGTRLPHFGVTTEARNTHPAHPGCERYRKHWTMRRPQSSLKKCLRLVNGQQAHFASWLPRNCDTIDRIL